MPCADFRLKDDVLDPLAPAKVLAVMSYPRDARGREMLLRRLPRRVTFPRHQTLQHNAGELWGREIWTEFLDHESVACLAGALTLGLAQLSAQGRVADVREVLHAAGTLVSEWKRVAERQAPVAELPIYRSTDDTWIIESYERYRSVSHLWGAVVYGKLKDRPDIQPISSAMLPTFLAYAEEIARLATGLVWRDDNRGLALEAETLWTFILPAAIQKKTQAQTADGPAPYRASAHSALQAPRQDRGS